MDHDNDRRDRQITTRPSRMITGVGERAAPRRTVVDKGRYLSLLSHPGGRLAGGPILSRSPPPPPPPPPRASRAALRAGAPWCASLGVPPLAARRHHTDA